MRKARGRAVVAGGGGAVGRDLAAVDEGDAVVPGDDQLLGEPLDLGLAGTPPHGQGLDGHEFPPARPLRDVGCGGQLVAVELADDLAALLALAGVGQEDRLLDDRIGHPLGLHDAADGVQGILGLLAERTPTGWGSGSEDVWDAVELDHGITATFAGLSSHHGSSFWGHSHAEGGGYVLGDRGGY